VDICRAIAAAVLGDATKVHFTPINSGDRFTALQKGEIDVLSRNTSWSFSRDAGLGLDFAATTYFDGQGFLAPKALGLSSAQELGGARICVQAGAASEGNLADYFQARGLSYKAVVVPSEADARRLYQSGACDVFTADVSALAGSRSVLDNPGAHVILPDVISKEPLGPVVRQNDAAWADIVRWTVYATILGEELGLTSKTVEQARETASDPQTRRLLGVEGDYGALLGLKRDWAFQVIRQVGAYHEIFRRDVGADSPLKLDRGLNALWSAPKPGLLYAPPLR
jgi:general L-amino acid transport system substrate-binding protein